MLKEKEEKQIKAAPVCKCDGHGKHTPPAPGRKMSFREAMESSKREHGDAYRILADNGFYICSCRKAIY